MSKLTVVVADSSRARIFGMDGPRLPMVEMESLLNPDARLADKDLRDDNSGSDVDAQGASAAQHGGSNGSMKANHIAQFAHQVADHIEHQRSVGKVEKLAVVAPPQFLGMLRDEFGNPARQCLVAEVDKNLVRESPDNIRKHLPKQF